MPTKKIPWKMTVQFLDACNCDWGCPCQFNAKPTYGKCEGFMGLHVKKGNYGNVKLDGLNFVLATVFPGPVHEGHGKAAFYVDDRATDEQFEALSKIVSGEAGGGPFAVYASVTETRQPPKRARIRFRTKGLTGQVEIQGVGGVTVEPIKNPVTGDIHKAILELPAGFEASRMHMASSQKLEFNDGFLNFSATGSYASIQETTWKGP